MIVAVYLFCCYILLFCFVVCSFVVVVWLLGVCFVMLQLYILFLFCNSCLYVCVQSCMYVSPGKEERL